MADKKLIFISFAAEDGAQRDMLREQPLNTNSSYEYVDISSKDVGHEDHREKVRSTIRQSDGVVVLISENSHTSDSQKLEIKLAKEENKKILGIWAYDRDRTNIEGIKADVWDADDLRNFIDEL